MSFFMKLIVMILMTAVVVGISYIIDNDLGIKDLINSKDAQESKQKKFIESELAFAAEKDYWFEGEIRKLAVENATDITLSNCRGVLSDKTNDDIYDSKIFGIEFKHKKEVVVHYNFCNLAVGGNVTVMLTTNNLIKNKQLLEGGDYYIPITTYKNHVSKGVATVTRDRGLIKLDDFMSF